MRFKKSLNTPRSFSKSLNTRNVRQSRIPERILKRKIMRYEQRRKLQLLQKNQNSESETEKKTKLQEFEEKLDAGANNDMEPELPAKKKKKQSINNTPETKVCNDQDEDKKITSSDGDKVSDYESEDLKDESTLGFDSSINRSFESLRSTVSSETMSAIDKMGFTEMTEIQAKAIPKLLEGRDLRGTAKTGSGKTLAFIIPAVELLHKLQFKSRNGTGVIIVSPTRELAMQTFGVLREVMADHKQTFGLIMGAAHLTAEHELLSAGVNILVATPGRLLDHLHNAPHFVYKNLVCLVIDEADRIFDVGFEEEIKLIARILPKHRQTMLFSATTDRRTNELAEVALRSKPIEVNVVEDKIQATVEELEQAFLVCPTDKRFLVLYTFIRKNKKKKVMVFFNSCMAVKFYSELLNFIGLPVTCIHGKQLQVTRTSIFYQFLSAEAGILLCTDIAQRGWDIPAVDWIVQYDPPDDPKEYIHRVGRTARAGRQGNALLFIREEEIGFIRYLKSHKVSVDPMEIIWSKVANIQAQLEKLMSENYYLRSSAREAFRGYVCAYDSHQLKDIFNIGNLDLKEVAKCFGFQVPPIIDLGVSASKQPQKRGGGENYGRKKKHQAKIFKNISGNLKYYTS